MVDLTKTVQWWEEQQLRLLVLGSLAIQVFLFFCTHLRKRAIHPLFRFLIWLAYLGGDALAIYALATLFNRHNQRDGAGGGCSQNGNSSVLEVLWAPILLMHIAGFGDITAYSIEDNELWRRHVITACSQVTVAVYVFCKTWPADGDELLLATAVILFYQGSSGCFLKPVLLQSGSVNGLEMSTDRTLRTSSARGGNKIHGTQLQDFVKQAIQQQQQQQHSLLSQANWDRLEVKEAMDLIFTKEAEAADHRPRPGSKHANDSDAMQNQARKQILDLVSPYSDRLIILKDLWLLTDAEVSDTLRRVLSDTFDALYTKKTMIALGEARTINSLKSAGLSSRLVTTFSTAYKLGRYLGFFMATTLLLASFCLFHKSHKEGYSDVDVKVTYTILCCSVVLQICSLVSRGLHNLSRWPEKVAQYSLVVFFVKKRASFRMLVVLLSPLLALVAMIHTGPNNYEAIAYLLQSCYSPPSCGKSSSRAITSLVLAHLKSGWKEYIKDAATYRMFNDERGQLTLRRKDCDSVLGWSLMVPFDESVLLWHMATDLCFYHHKGQGASPGRHQCDLRDAPAYAAASPHHQMAARCREMSNYMVHLLYENSEMLMVGARRHLFTAAHRELLQIFKENTPKNEKDLAQRIMANKAPQQPEPAEGSHQGGFIDDAQALAKALLDLGDDEKMWEVIQGVWVEMLCFSAGRCRGYLHAKSLGTGGEFLNYVWLLMSYMGMETLAERMQRTELPTSAAPQNTDLHTGGTAPITEIQTCAPITEIQTCDVV